MHRSLLMSALLVTVSCVSCSAGSASPPPLPPAEPSAKGDATADDLYGRYRHVGGTADAEARDAAIEAATEEMGSWIRDKARDRLTQLNEIPSVLAIAKTDAGVKVSGERDVVPAAPLGRAAVEFTAPNGETTLRVSFVKRGIKLVQTVQGPRGGTRRIFTPKAGGEKLDVRVIMYSKRLPQPVTYHLEYARQPNPATAATP